MQFWLLNNCNFLWAFGSACFGGMSESSETQFLIIITRIMTKDLWSHVAHSETLDEILLVSTSISPTLEFGLMSSSFLLMVFSDVHACEEFCFDCVISCTWTQSGFDFRQLRLAISGKTKRIKNDFQTNI